MDGSPAEARAVALDVIALYGDDPDLKAEVSRAKDMIKALRGQ